MNEKRFHPRFRHWRKRHIDNHDNVPTHQEMMEALVACAKTIMMHMDVALESAGLSGPKMWALRHLIESENPMGITDLAECIHSVKSNATQIVDRMEADGLVQRVPNPEDRRSVIIEVTEEGRERFEAGMAIMKSNAEHIFGDFKPPEQRHLMCSLAQIIHRAEDS